MIKIAPISGDLMIKIGAGVLLLGGVAMLIYTIKSQASAAAGWAANHLDPSNPENIAYSTVNTWGGELVADPMGPGKNADGSWSLGGWLYDVTHPTTAEAVANITK